MLDADGNASYPDFNNDGCSDGIVSTYCTNAPIDTDNDGTADFLDLDSDNDACADASEAATENSANVNVTDMSDPAANVDACGLVLNGANGFCQNPTNNDWINNCERKCLPDKDNDGIPDVLDVDDDNDGITDTNENLLNCPGGGGEIILNPFINIDFGTGGNTDFAGAGLPGTTTYNYAGVNGTVPDGAYQIMCCYYSQMFPFYANPTTTNGPADPNFEDHTSGDTNGRMLVVNASVDPGEFYRQTVNVPETGVVYFSAWMANLNAFAAKPDVTIQIRDASNTILATINTGILPDYTTANVAWQEFGVNLNITNPGNFTVLLINNAPGGFGNDVAIDDISFAKIARDCDFDGLVNELDLDSDNDGIPDAVEACGNINLNLEDCSLDSNADATYPDFNNDGCLDGLVSNYCTNAPIDTDNDGFPDFLDLDSDGDDCADSFEAGSNIYFGTNELTMSMPSAPVENCGLVISAQEGVCVVPENDAWRNNSEINICNPECDLNAPNADCDNDGIINFFDCKASDSLINTSNFSNNCNTDLLRFDFGN